MRTEKSSCEMKPNFDFIYIFPFGLVLIRITFGAKSFGKVYLQSKFGLYNLD